jgi:hypothetical protein
MENKNLLFFGFYTQISVIETKKILDKKYGKFPCFDFFQVFTISKMKTRTQIFPKMDKYDL